MNTNRILFHLGNFFIFTSLLGFAFVFYPIIQMYLFPPQPPTQKELTKVNKGFFLSIPKIHAYANVIANVDPWNEAEYKEALKHGVAQAKGTSLPGEKGTIFLFAHSSGAPWEITHTNTPFLRLPELSNGDIISIAYEGKLYRYKVFDKKEVWPSDIKYLDSKDNQLILQTCTPIGTSLRRLLVFAREDLHR